MGALQDQRSRNTWLSGGDSAGAAPERAPLELLLADETLFPNRGQIENTLNQVDPKTGTLELQAGFPNPRHTPAARPVRPRAFCSRGARTNVILVPQRAVQQDQSIQTVFTVGAR